MAFSRLSIAAVLAACLGWGVSARAAEPRRCDLGRKYPVSSVAQYQTENNYGYTTVKQFRGAQVYVPAQPGLTREWLARTLQDQIAAGTCDFGVRNVTVNVLSAGGGFEVQLSAPDEASAKQLYYQAQQLVR